MMTDARAFESTTNSDYDVQWTYFFQVSNVETTKVRVDRTNVFVMSSSLTQIITVVPLQKPPEKPWLRKRLNKERTQSISAVFTSLKKAEHHKSASLARPKRGKEEPVDRTAINSSKGLPRESPGM